MDSGNALEKSIGSKAPSTVQSSHNETDTSDNLSDGPDTSSSSDWKFLTTISALCLTIFCVALDSTIISTAVPRISDHFHTLQQVGWYASTYLFMDSTFQLLFGKLYSIFTRKYVYMISLGLFELGSLICAVSPNSSTFIAGRALGGTGAAGVSAGSMIIVSTLVKPEKRSVFTSLLGSMYGLAGVCGPLIGGALTDRVTWRWCFYLNLPIGGVTALALSACLKPEKSESPLSSGPWSLRIAALDLPGTALFTASIFCLLYALQLGGTSYAWSNGRLIALLVMFGLLWLAFALLQWLSPDHKASVPRSIRTQRNVISGSIFVFCTGSAFFIFIYFVPFYFQAIKGDSALKSGIDLLPFIVAWVVATLAAGALTVRIGYYMPFVLGSVIFMAVGAGLLTTLRVTSPAAHWIGYQIIYGFGAGLGFQQGTISAQATLKRSLVPIGTAFSLCALFLGGTVLVATANNIFTNRLIIHIESAGITDVDISHIIYVGATQVRGLVREDQLSALLEAYMAALRDVYRVGLIMACLSSVGAAGMEWVNVKQPRH